ncbi:protein DMP2-like [Andrographis paniculata]|uniref:protein DMP2-like n=1 Tax=Andrographis paniculata TaxID=175694 RepID=UPI0021E99F69|nr:protein DMP2-like [Andrographis paniculata]
MSSKSSSSSSTRNIPETTLTGLGNLIKLLPTGTVFLFQFLNPVLTNNGKCHVINKFLSGILIAICGASCGFASFTDSYTDSQGKTRYGIATRTGLWPNPESQDLSSYKLRVADFVHALFALIIFAVVSLLDTDSVKCFYPSFESNENMLLMALPPVIGAVSASVFAVFPSSRHGIGYPLTQGPPSTSNA